MHNPSVFAVAQCSKYIMQYLGGFWVRCSDHSQTPSWVFPLLHRVFFLTYLAEKKLDRFDTVPLSTVECIVSQIEELIEREVKPTHPDLVNGLLAGLDHTLEMAGV
ncbi:hypothetical protein JCM8547_002752 [Rhodosporidiobolus lusitaniae]